MDLQPLLPVVIVVAIMLLVGFPVHEFSHALAAYRLGDGTAKLFGRLTFNPIAHFSRIARSVLVKGAGLDVVYPDLLALLALASVFVAFSAWRFRSQLS